MIIFDNQIFRDELVAARNDTVANLFLAVEYGPRIALPCAAHGNVVALDNDAFIVRAGRNQDRIARPRLVNGVLNFFAGFDRKRLRVADDGLFFDRASGRTIFFL
ncbi:MAG: hypothetical protein DCC52_18405, partial [Chloroflexi bacterium]